jgi:hypothetical protein
MPEQFVCAVDEMDVQSSAPIQPYKTEGGQSTASAGRRWESGTWPIRLDLSVTREQEQ